MTFGRDKLAWNAVLWIVLLTMPYWMGAIGGYTELASRVVSVERLKPLHDKARTLLAPMRSNKLRLVYGDGMVGHPPGAPYDSIIAAAGGSALPDAWLEQLAVGGRLVSPVQQAGGGQALVVVDRRELGYERRVHETVRFVPLKSGLDR